MKQRVNLKSVKKAILVPALLALSFQTFASDIRTGLPADLPAELPSSAPRTRIEVPALKLDKEAIKKQLQDSIAKDMKANMEEVSESMKQQVKEDIKNRKIEAPKTQSDVKEEVAQQEEAPEKEVVAEKEEIIEKEEVAEKEVAKEEASANDIALSLGEEQSEEVNELADDAEAEVEAAGSEDILKSVLGENESPEVSEEIEEIAEVEEVAEVEEAEEAEEAEEEISQQRPERNPLESIVCKQSNQIDRLLSQVEELKSSSTEFMPMMSMMQQLMMMNMMMANNNQSTLSYQPTSIDLMSQMMAPMMMMQSMSMGMNMASMNNMYHSYKSPNPAAPQYNYNVGGDFYNGNYSMNQSLPGQQMPQQMFATQMPAQSTMAVDFTDRGANFGNMQSEAATERSPSQAESTESQSELAADEEMV